MKIAVLTGGGHVPTLNAGIEGITKTAINKGWEVVGATDGWKGMEQGNFLELNRENTDSIQYCGGSVLGNKRWNPNLDDVVKTAEKNDIDGIIALGGDDTLGVLADLWEEHGLPSAGWPKTMDNDLSGTYFCLGYPTAVSIASKTVLQSFDTAWTHGRVVLNVVFGRYTDWMSVGSAAYGDADMVVPAEKETHIKEIYERAKEAYFENEYDYGKPYAVVVVAEGASIEGLEDHVLTDETHTDEFGHPKLDPHTLVNSISDAIVHMSRGELDEKIDTATIALNYDVRNGDPLDVDREFGYKCGEKCVEIMEKNPGKMASIKRRNDELTVGTEDLTEGVKTKRVRDTDYLEYDNLKVNESYIEYASPFLGEPPKRQVHLLPRNK